MNFAAFGFILICCHVWIIKTNSYVINEHKSAEIEDDLKRLKSLLKLGIPLIDPFTKEQLPIHIDSFITLDVLFTNLTANRLSEYDINNADVDLSPGQSKVILDITWPLVTASTKYEKLVGKIGHYEVYGDQGDINMSIENIHFGATIHYTWNDDWKYMNVTRVETLLSLEKLLFRGTGFYNDEEMSNVLSLVISEIVPKIIEEKQKITTQMLNAMLMELFNNITSTLTFKEILDLLGINPFNYVHSVAV